MVACSPGDEAAIDRDRLPGDEARVIRAQPDDRVGDLLGRPHTADRFHGEHLGRGLSVVERVQLDIEPHDFFAGYLKTKKEKMGHLVSVA